MSAHGYGYVNKVTIGSPVYQGNAVGTSPTISSAIRQVNTNNPVKGATNPDLNCGPGAQLVAEVANANPGSIIEVSWVDGTIGSLPVSLIFFMIRRGRVLSFSQWPHVGPLMFYMAQCQGSCSLRLEWCQVVQDSRARLPVWQHLVSSRTP